MQKFDTPYLADWFAILMRWIVLLGITVSTALAGRLSMAPFLLLMCIGLWNSFASILAVTNTRLPFHRQVFSLADLIGGVGLFSLTGGLAGPVSWVGLLVCFTAAIYYEWRGGLLLAFAFSVAQVTETLLSSPGTFKPGSLLMLTGFNLSAGLILGYLGTQLIRELRRNRTKQLGVKKEIEQRIQRQEHDRMRSLYKLTASLTATLNYQRVLDYALDLGSEALNETEEAPQPIVCAVMLFQESALQVRSARRFTSGDQFIELPAESGILEEVFAQGETRLCPDPSQDPELSRLIALRACQSTVLLPLMRGLNLFGVLLYAHPAAEFFTPERIEILEVISHQVVIAMQNAELYQDLAEEKQRLIESQDEARKKLARDLHDGPTQSVAGIAMRIDLIQHLLDRDPAAVRDELAKVEDLALRTTQEIRHMLFTLRPLVLETEGLGAALQTMAVKVHDTYNQAVSIELDPHLVDQLEINKQTVVFFIAEEAVNNARKHAQAGQIWVRLRPVKGENDLALLEIEDNGLGFDPAEKLNHYEQRGSLGMVNLRERTQLLNGLLRIDSAPGKGARVQVFIPLTEAAADRLRQQ